MSAASPSPAPRAGRAGGAPLALVVLAAGASRRLGTCKALVAIGDTTPLASLLDAGRGLRDRPALVVGGAHQAALREALDEGTELVHNPAWERGRTGSVAVAQAARPGCDLLVAPVDVPLVPRAVFEALERAWREAGSPARGWLAPAVRSLPGEELRTGHPVVIGHALAQRLPELGSDQPLRELRRGADPLFRVEVESLSILDDLDGPEDLDRLRRRHKSR